jgi:hypothetical protein
MSLGLIALFSSLGYFEADMPVMAATGEAVGLRGGHHGLGMPWPVHATLLGRRGRKHREAAPERLRPRMRAPLAPPLRPQHPPPLTQPSFWLSAPPALLRAQWR